MPEPALVMAEGGDDANQALVKPRIPLFRGSTKDTISTMSWCESVDRQKAQLAWSESKTALAAIDAFREQAADWFRVVREEQPETLRSGRRSSRSWCNVSG